jgi:hypothetical protein
LQSFHPEKVLSTKLDESLYAFESFDAEMTQPINPFHVYKKGKTHYAHKSVSPPEDV